MEDSYFIKEELEMIKKEKRLNKLKKESDNRIYLILFAYILFFGCTFLCNAAETRTANEMEICKVHHKKKGSTLGWTCEYCKTYNPPAVSTCQVCRKPRGY